jgi:glycosidase
MKVAANLYLLSSGSPFLYYGEELGMRGSRGGANTDANRRLAMLWGDGDTVSDPPGADYPASKQSAAPAAEQIADANSLYTYYKTLLMIRHANPEIARGEYTAVRSESKVGGFVSVYRGQAVCVLHNATLDEQSFDLSSLTGHDFSAIAAAIGQGDAALDGSVLTLGPQTSVVLREK